jgi:hypothetical protein
LLMLGSGLDRIALRSAVLSLLVRGGQCYICWRCSACVDVLCVGVNFDSIAAD